MGISELHRHPSESGFALASVIVTAGLTATLTVTAFVAASGTATRTDRAEHREQALHLAEAAIARGITALAADAGYSTTPTQPPTPATRAWALGQAATAPLERSREGEYAWVVPEGADVVFGVGYIPSRSAASVTRVLRVDAVAAHNLDAYDVLMGSSLEISGNPTLGTSLHTNGDLEMSGNPVIDGDLTATGAYQSSGTPTVGGVSGGGYPAVSIPEANPRAYRSQADADLCPDGNVKSILGTTPCTGTVIGNGSGNGWNGWKHSSGKWEISGNDATDGVYYVYHANAKLSGNLGPWSATILVEGQTVAGVLSNGDLEVSGNLELTGDILVEGSSQAIAFIASRDIKISGNGELAGLIHAGEHFEMSGNSEIEGQLMASSTSDAASSPVHENKISGNPTISHPLSGPSSGSSVTSGSWTEL